MIASLYTHNKVGQDEEVLYAAIDAVGVDVSEWTPEYQRAVLDSYDGESEDVLEKMATDYIKARWPGFPITALGDLEEFALEHVVPDSRMFGRTEPGGTNRDASTAGAPERRSCSRSRCCAAARPGRNPSTTSASPVRKPAWASLVALQFRPVSGSTTP